RYGGRYAGPLEQVGPCACHRAGTPSALSRRADRSGVSCSCVSSPESRWLAVVVLERAAECGLRRVSDLFADEPDRKGGVAEQVGGGVEAYVCEVSGRRLSDPGDEPGRERRPGKAARSGQFVDCPGVAGVAV